MKYKMKTKLLYIFPLVGSIEKIKDIGSFYRLEKEMNYLERIFDVSLVTKDIKKYNDFKDVEHINLIKIPKSLVNLAFLFFPLFKSKQFKETNIYYVDHISAAFPAILGKFLFNKKVIIRFNWYWSFFVKREYNYITYLFVKFIENLAFKYSDTIIASTEKLGEIAIRKVSKKTKVVVIPNWIDLNLFKEKKSKKKRDIISIGRLEYQKNYLLLLKSIKNYKVTLIGNGSLKNSLINYSKKNKIDLEIKESVDYKSIPRYLNQHSMFLLTSRYEGHPKVIMEAMACKIPIIATNVVGNNDVVFNNYNGLLCNGNIKSISNCIKRLNKNKKLRNKIVKNGFSYVKRSCSFYSVMNKIVKEINGAKNGTK